MASRGVKIVSKKIFKMDLEKTYEHGQVGVSGVPCCRPLKNITGIQKANPPALEILHGAQGHGGGHAYENHRICDIDMPER